MAIGMVKHHGIKRGSGGSARMASAYINADIADEKVNIIMKQDTYSTEQLQGFLRDAGMSDLLAERLNSMNPLLRWRISSEPTSRLVD
jgi:hypothetical protein